MFALTQVGQLSLSLLLSVMTETIRIDRHLTIVENKLKNRKRNYHSLPLIIPKEENIWKLSKTIVMFTEKKAQPPPLKKKKK